MESYYDSEEEIAWGPVTLKEIKDDFKRPVLRVPNRRHTTVGSFQMDSSLSDDDIPESQLEDLTGLSQEVNKLNISETPTEYYTPNESLRTEQNSKFLEKLSKVIDNPHTDLSAYTSALENTKTSVTSEVQSKNESFKSVLNSEHSTSPSWPLADRNKLYEDSCLDFLKVAAGHRTTYDIANFQQSLVENTIYLSDNEIIVEDEPNYSDNENSFHENLEYNDRHTLVRSSEDEPNCSDNENSFHENLDYHDTHTLVRKQMLSPEEDVIVISDDEGSLLLNSSIVHDEAGSNIFVKKETNFENYACKGKYDMEDIEEEKVSHNSSVSSEDIQHKDESACDSGKSNVESHFTTEYKESLSASPVTIPEIDLTQFDDSTSKTNSPQFDDTLEEMNRLLTKGLDYTMSEEESIIENTPLKTAPKLESSFTPCNIISGSFSQSPSNNSFLKTKKKADKIPVRKFQLNASSDSRQPNRYNLVTSPKHTFKVPTTPVRTKPVNRTPSKPCSSHLKNVVSPVAVYIKNSPSAPLRQNIPQRELSKIAATKNPKPSSKENFPDFPEVVYKPAKKQIISKDKEITLPPSFKKLHITEPIIVKHEGRINQNPHKTEANRKLLQNDITNNSIDASVLNSSSDISVLTNKQAYIK